MKKSGFTDSQIIEAIKREAVRLAEQPYSNVSKIAQDHGVDPSVLRRWITQMRGGTCEPTAGKPLVARARRRRYPFQIPGRVYITPLLPTC